MTAKTALERLHAMRDRRKDAGLVRLDLYVHPDDHEAVKKLAARLQLRREKELKKKG